jgi:hypothetical protein
MLGEADLAVPGWLPIAPSFFVFIFPLFLNLFFVFFYFHFPRYMDAPPSTEGSLGGECH